MAIDEFEYEIGFSFLNDDHGTAKQLADLLGDESSIFIYSDQQKELAFQEGDESFRQVFLRKCRTVVVLLRDGWGETKWTRHEQQAIRDRAHEEGWEFAKFIALEKKTKTPKWLSPRYIYYDYEGYGIDVAAVIINEHVKLQGGVNVQASFEKVSQANQRRTDFLLHRKKFLRSENGVNQANQSVARLFEHLSNHIAKQKEEGKNTRTLFHDNHQYEVCYDYACLRVVWKSRFVNSLEESELSVEIWDKVLPGIGRVHYENPIMIASESYTFDIDFDSSPMWKQINAKNLISESKLSEKILSLLMLKEQDMINNSDW